MLDKAEKKIRHSGKQQGRKRATLPNARKGLKEMPPRGTNMLEVVVVEQLEEVDPGGGEPQ
eukprot:2463063-Prorocentrum_lima.AAC.1